MTANTPLVEYLNVAWRRKWHVILPTLIGLGIATGIYFALPKEYSATASVVPNQAQVSKELARPIVSPYLQMQQKQLNEVVKNKATLEGIFRKLKKLGPADEIDADAAAALKDAFSLDEGQGKIQFKVRNKDPQYAADLATAAAETFVETAGVDRDQWSSQVTTFMEQNAATAQ
jgi:capsular polysaccharide biosynthesis protein